MIMLKFMLKPDGPFYIFTLVADERKVLSSHNNAFIYKQKYQI